MAIDHDGDDILEGMVFVEPLDNVTMSVPVALRRGIRWPRLRHASKSEWRSGELLMPAWSQHILGARMRGCNSFMMEKEGVVV